MNFVILIISGLIGDDDIKGIGGWPTLSVAFAISFEAFGLDALRIQMIPLVQLNDIVCFAFWF